LKGKEGKRKKEKGKRKKEKGKRKKEKGKEGKEGKERERRKRGEESDGKDKLNQIAFQCGDCNCSSTDSSCHLANLILPLSFLKCFFVALQWLSLIEISITCKLLLHPSIQARSERIK